MLVTMSCGVNLMVTLSCAVNLLVILSYGVNLLVTLSCDVNMLFHFVLRCLYVSHLVLRNLLTTLFPSVFVALSLFVFNCYSPCLSVFAGILSYVMFLSVLLFQLPTQFIYLSNY